MKTVHVFNVDAYHQALNPIGQHRFSHYQRGAGVGGAFSLVKRYTIPVVKRFILPHVKNAAISTAVDVVRGTPVRSALKSNTANLIREIKADVIHSLTQQGKGITPRKQTIRKVLKPVTKLPPAKKKSSQSTPKTKTKKKSVIRKKVKSKLDIFDKAKWH